MQNEFKVNATCNNVIYGKKTSRLYVQMFSQNLRSQVRQFRTACGVDTFHRRNILLILMWRNLIYMTKIV